MTESKNNFYLEFEFKILLSFNTNFPSPKEER